VLRAHWLDSGGSRKGFLETRRSEAEQASSSLDPLRDPAHFGKQDGRGTSVGPWPVKLTLPSEKAEDLFHSGQEAHEPIAGGWRIGGTAWYASEK
jgi:hypothetical protein